MIDGHDKVKKPVADGHGSTSQKNPFFTTLLVDGPFGKEGVTEKFLKEEGHFVLKADSAEEALAMTAKFKPDLILLDSELKGIKGIELLPELMIEHPEAAVIILASTPRVADAIEAIKWGAVDVLDRPLDLKKLKLAIDIQKKLFKQP